MVKMMKWFLCVLLVALLGTTVQAAMISHSTAGVLVNDDFESYAAGTLSDGLNPNYWYPRSGYYNVSVTNAAEPGAYQGNNYLSLVRPSDGYTTFFSTFTSQAAGVITVNLAMYVPSGQFQNAAAILFEPDNTDQSVTAGLLVADTGWVGYLNNGWQSTGIGVTFDTWQEWTINYNLANDSMTLNIGGNSAVVSGTGIGGSVGALFISPGAFGTNFYIDAVPEPVTLSLVLVGGLLGLRRKV